MLSYRPRNEGTCNKHAPTYLNYQLNDLYKVLAYLGIRFDMSKYTGHFSVSERLVNRVLLMIAAPNMSYLATCIFYNTLQWEFRYLEPPFLTTYTCNYANC